MPNNSENKIPEEMLPEPSPKVPMSKSKKVAITTGVIGGAVVVAAAVAIPIVLLHNKKGDSTKELNVVQPSKSFKETPLDQDNAASELLEDSSEHIFNVAKKLFPEYVGKLSFNDFIHNIYLTSKWKIGEPLKAELSEKSDVSKVITFDFAETIEDENHIYPQVQWFGHIDQEASQDNFKTGERFDVLSDGLSNDQIKQLNDELKREAFSEDVDQKRILDEVEKLAADANFKPTLKLNAQGKKAADITVADLELPKVPDEYKSDIGIKVENLSGSSDGSISMNFVIFSKDKTQPIERSESRTLQTKSDTELNLQSIVDSFAKSIQNSPLSHVILSSAISSKLPSTVTVADFNSVTYKLIPKELANPILQSIVSTDDAAGSITVSVLVQPKDTRDTSIVPKTAQLVLTGLKTTTAQQNDDAQKAVDAEEKRIEGILSSANYALKVDQLSFSAIHQDVDSAFLTTLGISNLNLDSNFKYSFRSHELLADGSLPFTIAISDATKTNIHSTNNAAGSLSITGINHKKAEAIAASISTNEIKTKLLSLLSNIATTDATTVTLPSTVKITEGNVLISNVSADKNHGTIAFDWSYVDANFADVKNSGHGVISGFETQATPQEIIDSIQKELDAITAPILLANQNTLLPSLITTNNAVKLAAKAAVNSQLSNIANTTQTITYVSGDDATGQMVYKLTYSMTSNGQTVEATKDITFSGFQTTTQRAQANINHEQAKMNQITGLALTVDATTYSVAHGTALTQAILDTLQSSNTEKITLASDYTYTYETLSTLSNDGNVQIKIFVSKTNLNPTQTATPINVSVTGIDHAKSVVQAKAELAAEQTRVNALSGSMNPSAVSAAETDVAITTQTQFDKFGTGLTLDLTKFSYKYTIAAISQDGNVDFKIDVTSKSQLLDSTNNSATGTQGSIAISGLDTILENAKALADINAEQSRIEGILTSNAAKRIVTIDATSLGTSTSIDAASNIIDSTLMTALGLKSNFEYQLLSTSAITANGQAQLSLRVISTTISGHKHSHPATDSKFSFTVNGIDEHLLTAEVAKIQGQINAHQSHVVSYIYNEVDRAALDGNNPAYGTTAFDPSHIGIPVLPATNVDSNVIAKYGLGITLDSGFTFKYSHPAISSDSTVVTLSISKGNAAAQTIDINYHVDGFAELVKNIQEEELQLYLSKTNLILHANKAAYSNVNNWVTLSKQNTDPTNPDAVFHMDPAQRTRIFDELGIIEFMVSISATGSDTPSFATIGGATLKYDLSSQKISADPNAYPAFQFKANIDGFDDAATHTQLETASQLFSKLVYSSDKPMFHMVPTMGADNNLGPEEFTTAARLISIVNNNGFTLNPFSLDFDHFTYAFEVKGHQTDPAKCLVTIYVKSKTNPSLSLSKEITVAVQKSTETVLDAKIKNFLSSGGGQRVNVQQKDTYTDADVRAYFPSLSSEFSATDYQFSAKVIDIGVGQDFVIFAEYKGSDIGRNFMLEKAVRVTAASPAPTPDMEAQSIYI